MNFAAMLLNGYKVFVDVSALKVHMSDNAHTAIMSFPEFITEPRGEIFVKVEQQVICFVETARHFVLLGCVDEINQSVN